ncbi:hypothetical protein DMC47_41890 [Nostoc sp. 3335mG]|nr:hypothetical protein DMC47_41890 [Nostoc sp. 3335mG]
MNAQEKQAANRLAILIGLRIGGAILCLLGLWMVLGGNLAGRYGFGWVLVVVGLIELVVVPKILAGKWKTP